MCFPVTLADNCFFSSSISASALVMVSVTFFLLERSNSTVQVSGMQISNLASNARPFGFIIASVMKLPLWCGAVGSYIEGVRLIVEADIELLKELFDDAWQYEIVGWRYDA